MRRVRWLLSTLLLTSVVIASIPVIPPSNAVAAGQSQHKSLLAKLIAIFKPILHRGRTRGSVCVITPGMGDEETTWSDRPLFVWKEEVSRIEVRLASDDTPIWSHLLSTTSRSVTYNGHPLQPGQTYEVIFFGRDGNQLNNDPNFYPKFTLLEATEHDRIAQDLTAQENQLKNQQATDEAIALEKAIYFSKQQLWSDAFQVVYSVPNPSPDLQAFVQNAYAKKCGEE